MIFVIIINLIAIIGLFRIALTEGLEAALPFAAFTVVFVPIESSIPLGLFSLTTQRIVVAVLVLLYLTVGRNETGLQPRSSMPLKTLIVIHVLWCVLSTANSVVPLMSVKKAISVVLEYYTLYFVFWKTISKPETIRGIIFAIVLAMIVCSVFGAFEAYGAGNIISVLPKAEHHFDLGADTDREVRVQATFDHPILFGAALAMGIILSIYLLSVEKESWHVGVLWAGLLLMFLNIYKTSSRGPWLDVILGFLLLFVLGRSGIRKPILIIVVLAVTSMIIRPGIWGTVKGIYDNSFDMNTSTGTSYQYRYALQQAVTERLLRDPSRAFWGYGLESFYDLRIQGDFLGEPHLFLSCDNAWAELMIETGFVGCFMIALMMLATAHKAWQEYRAKSLPGSALGLALFVNVVIFCFQMYSVGMYSWGQNGYMLWILIALTFAYAKCGNEADSLTAVKHTGQFSNAEPVFQTT